MTKTKPGAEALRAVAHLIDGSIDGNRDALIDTLKATHGLKLTQPSGHTRASMLGVSATSTAGARMALINWANAARRAANRLETAS